MSEHRTEIGHQDVEGAMVDVFGRALLKTATDIGLQPVQTVELVEAFAGYLAANLKCARALPVGESHLPL